jgi:hypothetical protein
MLQVTKLDIVMLPSIFVESTSHRCVSENGNFYDLNGDGGDEGKVL